MTINKIILHETLFGKRKAQYPRCNVVSESALSFAQFLAKLGHLTPLSTNEFFLSSW
jgi:hypothetical protein